MLENDAQKTSTRLTQAEEEIEALKRMIQAMSEISIPSAGGATINVDNT